MAPLCELWRTARSRSGVGMRRVRLEIGHNDGATSKLSFRGDDGGRQVRIIVV